MVTQQEIFRLLEEFDISPDTAVVLHSALKSVGAIENGADGLLDALCSYLAEGLLVIPTHTWAYTPSLGLYDVKNTPTCLGVLSRVALKRSEAFRSLHPTHSVAAFGKRAAEWFCGEETCTSPAPHTSWMRRLCESGGKILLIGVDMRSNTYLHWVEESLGVPNRLSEQTLRIQIINHTGRLLEAQPFHWYQTKGVPEGCSEHFNNYVAPLVYAGAVRQSTLGKARVYCCDAKSTYSVLSELWKAAEYDLCSVDKPIPERYYIK